MLTVHTRSFTLHTAPCVRLHGASDGMSSGRMASFLSISNDKYFVSGVVDVPKTSQCGLRN